MRLLLKLIAVIVIVIITVLIALPFVVDPNDYKQQISEQVEKATGRELTLDGDIGLSVFPWVALELGATTLSNAEGFSAPHFAHIDGAQIRIKLLPLLDKSLEMDTVVLNGLTLNLEKNKAGVTNWDDLGKTNETEAESTEETVKSDSSSEPGLAALSIAGVELTDANIVWSDASTGESYTIKSLNLTTDPLVDGEPTDIELNFSVAGEGKQTLAADVSLATSLLADLEKQLFTLSDFNLKTKAEGDVLPVPKAELAINGDIAADLQAQTAQLSGLNIEANDLLIKTDLNISQLSSERPQFNGQLNIEPINIRRLMQQLAIALPAMADSNTLELLQLTSELSGSSDDIALNNMVLTLDQSQLTGDLAVKQFANPAINFNLALDEIDVDRYLPPAQQASETGASANEAKSSPAAAEASSDELPLEMLRSLNLDGRLTIGKLKVSGTNSSNIDINVSADKGAIKLHPLKADLYQGQYSGNVKLNAKKNSLAVSIDEQLSQVQAGPLLVDLAQNDTLSGVANAKVALSGSGKTVDQIKRSLTGNGEFAFTDGAINGVDIVGSIRKAKAALSGKTIADSELAGQTNFSSLTGSFTAKKGDINNPDFALVSPLLRVDGNGSVNLGTEAIDYGLNAAILATKDTPLGKELVELKGLKVPVKITGSFSDPKPQVDLATLLHDNATQKVKDKVNEKLKDKLGDKLGDVIGGGLLGSSSSDSESDSANETEQDEPKSVEDALKNELGNQLKGLF